MTKNTPSPTTITSPMAAAPEGTAPAIASGSSPRSAAPRSAPVAKLTKCGRMRALRSSGTHRNATANAALAMPPNAANRMIHSSSMIDPSHQPDQRRHAPAFSVATVGKEAQRIRVRAPVTAEHRAHPGALEPAPGERAKIALPAAAAVGAERLRRGCIVRQEGGTHLAPHLEVCRTDRRAQPGDEAPRRDTLRGGGRGEIGRAHA